MSRPVFHLSFPVSDLADARRFYCDLLGCLPGRTGEGWMGFWFFGHQLTLHQLPTQVQSAKQLGVRHFGIVLAWPAWEAQAARLAQKGAVLEVPPEISYQNTPREQGKLLLRDPSNNLIELKAYRDPVTALALPDGVSI